MYKVTKQYGRGPQTAVRNFADLVEAKSFINAELLNDERMKVKTTYSLFEGMDLIGEFSESWEKPVEDSGSTGAGSGGASQGSRFQPTPFNATPRPAGMPSNWVKDDDKKEDNKEDK